MNNSFDFYDQVFIDLKDNVDEEDDGSAEVRQKEEIESNPVIDSDEGERLVFLVYAKDKEKILISGLKTVKILLKKSTMN